MSSLRHVGVIAHNVNALSAFYIQALGLTLLDTRIEQGEYIEKLTGTTETRLEWAKLIDGNGIILELLHYHGFSATPCTPARSGTTGTTHVAFTVANAAATAQKIHEAGGSCGELVTNPEGTVHVFYGRDPEGNLIEIVQPLSSGDQELRGFNRRNAMGYENAFYWFSSPARLAKIMAHYDLYTRILNVPGAIVETGCFKASSLIRFSAFRKLLDQNQREIYVFDMFGQFPVESGLAAEHQYSLEYDAKFGLGLKQDEIMHLLKSHGTQSNVIMVEGDICATMPGYFLDKSLALVHVDVELYRPTQSIIEECWKNLSPGGLIIFDDYDESTMAKEAIDTFLHTYNTQIERLKYTDTPVFCVKK